MKNTVANNSASACMTWIQPSESAACMTWIQPSESAACMTWIKQGSPSAQRPTVSLSLENLEEALS